MHWDDPEGWYGKGGGKEVQDGEHVYTCGEFMLKFDRKQQNSVKKLPFNKK